MKFGDKLILLRKKNGLSQEELAEKLGVSRQSVSKWESNNTYPETDKIVQICNIFNCSMDDLINDNITDIEQIERVNKNNLNEIWDSLLEFITKTVSMFSRMKFLDGVKCVIELIIISFLLYIMGSIICNLTGSIISHLFVFLSEKNVLIIENVIISICNLFWFILAIIILIHVFKIRYLNPYDKVVEEENIKKNKKENDNNKNAIKKNIKSEKIVIRDEEERPFAFLGVMSKFVLGFIKFIISCIALGIMFTIIGLVIVSFLMIVMIPVNVLFVGLSLSSIAATTIAILLLLVSIYFIMSKQIPVKIYTIIFVISLVVLGIGIGISVVSIKNFDVVEEKNTKYLEDKVTNISYEDNLVILSANNNLYSYIVDSNMSDNQIIVTNKIDSRYERISVSDEFEDGMNIKNISAQFNGDYKSIYNDFINNVKNNKIVSISDTNSGVTIRGNENTINKLIDNLKKLYLVEESIDNNIITVILHESKVYFPNGINGEYDARSDTLNLFDDNDQCERSVKSTKWGDRIIFTCEEENYDD